jgi:dipeptide/tripeptide permease
MDKVHEVKFNYIIIYTKLLQELFDLFYRLLKLRQYPWSFAFLLLSFGLGFVILYVSKYYKQNSSSKEKVSMRYDFVTGLRWL